MGPHRSRATVIPAPTEAAIEQIHGNDQAPLTGFLDDRRRLLQRPRQRLRVGLVDRDGMLTPFPWSDRPGGDDHVEPGLGQRDRAGPSNPTAGSGHESDLRRHEPRPSVVRVAGASIPVERGECLELLDVVRSRVVHERDRHDRGPGVPPNLHCVQTLGGLAHRVHRRIGTHPDVEPVGHIGGGQHGGQLSRRGSPVRCGGRDPGVTELDGPQKGASGVTADPQGHRGLDGVGIHDELVIVVVRAVVAHFAA